MSAVAGAERMVAGAQEGACNCPVLPALDEMNAEQLQQVMSKPLCCESCGEELELRCPEGHVHHVPKTRSPNERPAAMHDAVEAKNCPECRQPFMPRRYQRRCDSCQASADRKCTKCGTTMAVRAKLCRVCNPPIARGSHGGRVYQQKACAGCRKPFTPTGPRALRCGGCR